jgi:hypothetical protein
MEGQKLSVVCSPYTQRAEGPNGRQKKLTVVTVKLGKDAIATRTIPGTWTPANALTEFRRFPDRFTRTVAAAALDLKACATLTAA